MTYLLFAMNKRAADVVMHPANRHLLVISKTPDDPNLCLDWPIVKDKNDNITCLSLGTVPSKLGGTVVASFGRGFEADILVPEQDISKVHCSLQVPRPPDRNTNITLVFADHSRNLSSALLGKNAPAFLPQGERRVALWKDDYKGRTIGMGGHRCNRYLFRVYWHDECESFATPRVVPQEVVDLVLGQQHPAVPDDHRRVDTPDRRTPKEIASSSTGEQQLARPAPENIDHRVRYGRDIGEGGYGKVVRGLDVETGRVLAIKRAKDDTAQARIGMRLEVAMLLRCRHPNVVDVFSEQGWVDRSRYPVTFIPQLMMTMSEGDLCTLVAFRDVSLTPKELELIAHTTLVQMLSALAHLEKLCVAHKDLKPENILYRQTGDLARPLDLLLSDFGCAVDASGDALAETGTWDYMAPELMGFPSGAVQLTPENRTRQDVWALFLSMAWILDVRGFRTGRYRLSTREVRGAKSAFFGQRDGRGRVMTGASATHWRILNLHRDMADNDEALALLRPMSRLDPNERCSATWMLAQLRNRGLAPPEPGMEGPGGMMTFDFGYAGSM